ncbi:MAG: serine hydrolase domain-containing protein [Pseudomonadota bacterium]
MSFAAAGQLSMPALAQASAPLAAALAAIRAYGEAHLKHFGLPGMALGLTTPDGFATVFNFGFANRDARTAITPETLFEIGSITKLMTAAVVHQLAAEGRLSLTDRVGARLPSLPLPAGNAIQVQHLLDHVAGLPADAPLSPEGGLWTAYRPGAHWHYSNIGYEMLGKIAEHVAGQPLARLLQARIFAPLGMARSRGAIVADDRALYAQGYDSADTSGAYARGLPLAPAAWVDMTKGAGCVGSTADDMTRLMRSLANAAQGRGGLGLSPVAAKAFTNHAVPSDTRGMTYGNGLMHVGERGRSYLHHTGGMVSFSSSFHIDTASSVGAFASSNIGFNAEYRPRLLTRFAVDVLTDALAGRPLPQPPPLAIQLANAQSYVGRYVGPAGSFEIRAGNPLTIFANGQSADLQPWGGEIFRTTHPAFRRFSLMFDRKGPAITGAGWGPSSYARGAIDTPASNPKLARLAGRYTNDSPWLGTANVVERGGRLWIGTETPMIAMADNLWRIGEESWSPERGSFADFIDGRPNTFVFSGERYTRREV